jgi:hypothetical protein
MIFMKGQEKTSSFVIFFETHGYIQQLIIWNIWEPASKWIECHDHNL